MTQVALHLEGVGAIRVVELTNSNNIQLQSLAGVYINYILPGKIVFLNITCYLTVMTNGRQF